MGELCVRVRIDCLAYKIESKLLMDEIRGLGFNHRAGRIRHDTVLRKVCYPCDILKGVGLPGGFDAQMNPQNSLNASNKYSEYNKDLIYLEIAS